MKACLATLIISLPLFASCASVREVKTQPGRGGVIAVQEGFIGEPASVKSDRIIRENCPYGYSILEKGEEKIGTRTTSSGSSSTKSSGKSKGSGFLSVISDSDSETQTSGNSETADVNEWRVKYKCKRARADARN